MQIKTRSITILLPDKITLPRKKTKDKTIRLNFNQVKPLHHFTYNELKIKFKELLHEMNPNLPKLLELSQNKPITQAELIFSYWHGTNHEPDLDNLSFIAKFALDALQQDPKDPDKPYLLNNDSVSHIGKITHEFKGYDKLNPRVELTIFW